MTGTIINIIAVLVGSSLGLLFGGRLPERIRKTVVAGIGLITTAIGLQMFFKSQNPIIVLGSILVGGLLGEWWGIEAGLRRLGALLENRFANREVPGPNYDGTQDKLLPISSGSSQKISETSRFIRGFLSASLLFCVGPMTILGSIKDGLTGDYSLLAIKSVLDGFAALAFASTLGIGVMFSTLIILAYQGGLTLLAAQVQALMTTPMVNEMTATGGVMLLGIGVNILWEDKNIHVGNFLPALVIAPLIVAILKALGI